CWDDCSEACGVTTKRWLRQTADWWSPEARQQAAERNGLRLPKDLKPEGRLVVLIHGLDSDAAYWQDVVALLEAEGHAVAWLDYPNDQPVADSARLLADEMAALRRRYPQLNVDIIAHSMGGILARAYVESDDYACGVERLILLAPPNQGSCYSRFSVCCDAVEHFHRWRNEPGWSWTWMIADGLGEARHDIAPGSRYLAELNARGRRRGVRYTIVAGNRSCGWRYAGNVLRWSAVCVPSAGWGTDLGGKLHTWAEELESHECSNDGLVTLQSAFLPGVDDLVIVPADHTTLACSRNGRPPVAWPIIHDRLSK
ncbi:MAG TPA: alpha/beta fold hydrolase, partial [Pirellulales bacterium]|nr:alpha/beta fold hydrolase [Pirellulales bacterium]